MGERVLSLPGASYRLERGWGRLPRGMAFGHVVGLAVDGEDNVYVLNRGERRVVVFSREGDYLGAWGGKEQTAPHGLHIEGDVAYVADYRDHVVRLFDLEGRLLDVWGTPGVAGAEGEPFNRPTNVDVAPTGRVYVSDGYGNARVHVFTGEGELLFSWGRHGSGPGEFNLCHDVCLDGERVLVADRQNHRIQVFTLEGAYLEEWVGLKQPCGLALDAEGRVFVAELQARLTVLDPHGGPLAHWGGEGLFLNPHCVCFDSRGDLYVGETLEGSRVQKFTRL